MSSEQSFPRDVEEITLSAMEGLSCPRSLSVAILLRYQEWEQIASLDCDPTQYNTAESVWAARAATGFLKKCEGLPGLDHDFRHEKAVKQFFVNEAQCYRTNQRLYRYVYGTDDVEDGGIRSFISDVKRVVVEILGNSPPANWDGKFGPGATMNDKSVLATVPDKMSSVPTITSEAWPFMFPWTGTLWAKAVAASDAGRVDFIRGNSFFSVFKNAFANRGCGKEPSINLFYQLGLGSIMKGKLSNWGLDLQLGQDVHRQVACAASLGGHLATIDLSQASDNMSSALVKLLTPPAWFEVLDSLRSHTTLVDGKQVYLEKFSSMGNGFTFELETVLFAAICFTACRGASTPGKHLFVYGDDIIVPTRFSRDVMSALTFFGFQVNKTKSFVSGSFRESCGGDFYSGEAVRPFHLKELPYEPQQYISLANGIRRLGLHGLGGVRMPSLRRAWFKVLDQIPTLIRRCRGPEALGDLVIHDIEAQWDMRWRDNCIRYIRVFRPARYKRVRWDGFSYDVQLAAACYGVVRKKFFRQGPSTFSASSYKGYDSSVPLAHAIDQGVLVTTFRTNGWEGDLVPRDGVTGYKVGWVPFS